MPFCGRRLLERAPHGCAGRRTRQRAPGALGGLGFTGIGLVVPASDGDGQASAGTSFLKCMKKPLKKNDSSRWRILTQRRQCDARIAKMGGGNTPLPLTTYPVRALFGRARNVDIRTMPPSCLLCDALAAVGIAHQPLTTPVSRHAGLLLGILTSRASRPLRKGLGDVQAGRPARRGWRWQRANTDFFMMARLRQTT